MKKALFLTLFFTCFAQGYEFQHLKLKGRLAQKALGHKHSSVSVKRAALIGQEQESTIYQTIVDRLQHTYQKEGRDQVNSILNYNHNFSLGEHNFSGFTWHRPMGNFSISVHRQVAPNLVGLDWIVQDTFTLHIDATTFLSDLKERNQIDISKQQLSAFAGLTFRRTYEMFHYADSFESGLSKDFSTLFLPFLRFNRNALFSEHYRGEIFKRRDFLGLEAGAYLNTPSFYGFSASAGVLYQHNQVGELTLQHIIPSEQKYSDERLRLSLSTEKISNTQAKASVALDFFNLLKIELLSFELERELREAHEYHLSFGESDHQLMRESPEHDREFRYLLNMKVKKIDLFAKNIVQLEQRMAENLTSQFSFLLFGGQRSRETEQFTIIRNNQHHFFYKTHESRLRYIQNGVSKLFGLTLQALFQFDGLVRNNVENTQQFSIEYQSQSGEHDMEVTSTQDFSIAIDENLRANKTTGVFNKKYKEEAIRYLVMMTETPYEIIHKLNRDELRGPLQISTSLRILQDGLDYFHGLDDDTFYYILAFSCFSKRIEKWSNSRDRRDLLRGYTIKKRRFLWWKWKARVPIKKDRAYRCTKNIGAHRDSYMTSFKKSHSYQLAKLKKFVKDLYLQTQSYDYLRAFFGQEHAFVYGNFYATTRDGHPFQTYYRDGQFSGNGIIDNFAMGE